jgi:uncharacterized protein YjbI with pentapeptide repeats
MTTPQLPTIKNSTILGTTIRDAAFTLCTLKHVEIHGSTISGSTLSDCQLSNCTIDDSSLVNSKLHETKIVNCSMDNCSMTSSTSVFRKFSPEIRAMIFARCIHFNKNKTPALLIALRGDKELYREAIHFFYNLNWFRVRLGNLAEFESMSKKAIENIRKLIIS